MRLSFDEPRPGRPGGAWVAGRLRFSFEGARLQPCREALINGGALAPEGSTSRCPLICKTLFIYRATVSFTIVLWSTRDPALGDCATTSPGFTGSLIGASPLPTAGTDSLT